MSRKTRRLPAAASRGLILAAFLGGVLALAGCGQPTVAPENLRLTVTLRTALSARNPQWLQLNLDEIERRHAEGTLGDEEHAALLAIVEQGRAGKWEAAERAVVRLQEAQRPSREAQDRLPLAAR